MFHLQIDHSVPVQALLQWSLCTCEYLSYPGIHLGGQHLLDEFLDHGLQKDTTVAPWFLLLSGSIGEFLCLVSVLWAVAECRQSLMTRGIPLGLS